MSRPLLAALARDKGHEVHWSIVDDLPRISLEGSKPALGLLAAVLRDGKNERVNADGTMHWLRSKEFHGPIGDPDAVRRKAEELLPRINGMMKALVPSLRPVRLGQCVDWVQPDGRLKRRLTETVRGVVVPKIPDIHESTAIGNRLEGWAAIEPRDPRVADVLALWGSTPEHDWSTLYKLKEKLEALVGSSVIVQRGWATKAELRCFDHTANSPAVAGGSARHGVQTNEPPAKPLTLVEAQDLFARLIRAFLDAQSS